MSHLQVSMIVFFCRRVDGPHLHELNPGIQRGELLKSSDLDSCLFYPDPRPKSNSYPDPAFSLLCLKWDFCIITSEFLKKTVFF